LFVDPLNSRNVAAESDDRRIHDRVDAARLALAQLLHRVHHPRVLIPGIRIVGVVLPHIGAEDKYVLMHQHLAQVGDADRPADGFHYGHSSSVVSKRYGASSHRISDRTVGAPCSYQEVMSTLFGDGRCDLNGWRRHSSRIPLVATTDVSPSGQHRCHHAA